MADPAPAAPLPVAAAGAAVGRGHQGRGDRGRGGRGRERGRGRYGRGGRNPESVRARVATPTFKGNTPDMNGHVFQCHNEAANASQFLKTIEALSEYINKNLNFPKDIASLCEDHSVSEIIEPKDLVNEEEKSKTKTLIWETKVKAYVKRCDEQEKNLRAIFSTVWGQCSTAMQSKLQSLDGYNEKKTECDCSWILKEIKGITHRFEGTRYVFLSIN